MRNTLLNILRATYNTDKVLQDRYKTYDSFIDAFYKAKTKKDFTTIFAGTEAERTAKENTINFI